MTDEQERTVTHEVPEHRRYAGDEMRVLFVSGSPGGGSLQSTSELAQRLGRRGHAVGLLQRAYGGRLRVYLHKRMTNLEAKLAPRRAAPAVAAIAHVIGRHAEPLDGDAALARWRTLLPENALHSVVRRFRPDVVIVSSIDRRAWRQMREELAAAGIASGLYLREESSLGHITAAGAPADIYLANSEVLTRELQALGCECVTIPSLVELDRCLVESSRARVLFVNPVAISGVDIAIAVAAARPDIPFAFAESWKLDAEARSALDARLRGLDNVELRARVDDPSLVYRDARVMLAPYLSNGRPRVVLEAHANGIPVLATDIPAMREAVGIGGRFVDAEAPVEVWAAALDAMLEPAAYEELTQLARLQAARPDVDPEQIVSAFERAVGALLEGAPSA
jgi:glycosyltransferase involved in cell wall biosynthesis